MSNEKILSVSTEYICLTEKEAFDLVEQKRAEDVLEKYNVIYKKPTKKKTEHWIVTIKERIASAEDYVSMEVE